MITGFLGERDPENGNHSLRSERQGRQEKILESCAIAANGYNIAVSSHVEQEDTREAVDMQTLNAVIACIVTRQAELRSAIDAIAADLEGEQA